MWLYCGSPELIAVTNRDSLPERFAVTIVDPGDWVAVRDALKGMSGVDTVVRVQK